MNGSRRKFLKILFVGGSGALVQKFLGPVFNRLFADTSAKNALLNKASFSNFKVIKNEKGLSIYDSSGQEIFQIDNGK